MQEMQQKCIKHGRANVMQWDCFPASVYWWDYNSSHCLYEQSYFWAAENGEQQFISQKWLEFHKSSNNVAISSTQNIQEITPQSFHDYNIWKIPFKKASMETVGKPQEDEWHHVITTFWQNGVQTDTLNIELCASQIV